MSSAAAVSTSNSTLPPLLSLKLIWPKPFDPME